MTGQLWEQLGDYQWINEQTGAKLAGKRGHGFAELLDGQVHVHLPVLKGRADHPIGSPLDGTRHELSFPVPHGDDDHKTWQLLLLTAMRFGEVMATDRPESAARNS